ncbi:Rho GTPase activation protein [Calocera viscosa TUFC12733]|uniref:Rho GTPase activation protein n=1 Tax=Calocera viscosa (strain TUFC12733) TaxID=1330018 RepID=A0A167FGW1_CALVF|nr:Rho GTPase activation protein [Calocera viscosa TUFC12733]
MRALFFNRFIHPAAILPEIFEIVPTCSRVTHGPNTCDELTTHSGFDSAAEEPMFVPALAEHACWDINDNTFRCASTYKLYKSTLSTTCPGPRFQVDPVLDTQSQSGDPKILQSGDPKTLISKSSLVKQLALLIMALVLQIATLLSLVLFLFVRWISSKRSLVRATQQGEQYRQLTMDKNVTVSTIKNFVHAQSSVSPKQISWLRETLCTLVEEVIGQSASSLETDPVVIYRSLINAEETRSGISSGKPIVVTFEDAAVDPHTRAEYIRHLQMLRHLTEQFVNAIFGSVRKMPHGIRSIARDFLAATKVKFPDQADEVYAAAVGRLLYLRFIHPAIVAPDTFDMVPNTIGAAARRNLAEIAKMLTQISSSSPFREDTPSLVPLNACITTAVRQLHKWLGSC